MDPHVESLVLREGLAESRLRPPTFIGLTTKPIAVSRSKTPTLAHRSAAIRSGDRARFETITPTIRRSNDSVKEVHSSAMLDGL